MSQAERESLTDSDPHSLLFGSSEDGFFDDEPGERPLPRVQRVSRSELRAERGRRVSRRRRRRAVILMALLLVAMVGAAVWLVGLPLYRYFNPSDYSGTGRGTAIVEIPPNATAQDIGGVLHDKGVVASVRAFTDAAKADPRSTGIQPGSYKLRLHMSAQSALGLLLTPAARVNADVVVTEGATALDVVKRLTAKPCADNASASAICGPGMNAAAVKKSIEDVKGLGLPTDYTVNGKTPASVEGFLYPATYFFPQATGASDALQQMITQFTDAVRKTDFTAAARANHLTPYQELIIASIAQAEAKYPEDYGKVARVILNRLAAHRALQIDATSAYAYKIKGLDPTKQIYADVKGAYNTYKHDGLPPTPIGNPGAAAMAGAASPPKGDWIYYVNKDAAGHLFFTNSEHAFLQAAAKCRANNWGCG